MPVTKNLSQYGDTIIEVLVAITVVSMVLTGAYISSNNSLNHSRQSQERGEALKVVEGQLDRLKARGKTKNDDVYIKASPFCIDSGNIVVSPISASCNIAPVGGGVAYEISIERLGTSQFSVIAKWDRAGGGNGREQATIKYRMYPSL